MTDPFPEPRNQIERVLAAQREFNRARDNHALVRARGEEGAPLNRAEDQLRRATDALNEAINPVIDPRQHAEDAASVEEAAWAELMDAHARYDVARANRIAAERVLAADREQRQEVPPYAPQPDPQP